MSRRTRPSRSGLPAGVLVLTLLPLLVVVDTAAARARGWSLVSRLDTLVFVAALLALCATLVIVAVRPMRRRLARLGGKLALLAVGLGAGWLAGEVALAVLFRGVGFHVREVGLVVRFDPAPGVMPGVAGPSHYTVNGRGIRGPEFPSAAGGTRVLCIGGSTTECLYLDDKEAWPALVAGRLERTDGIPAPVWVGASGISGLAMPDHLEFVRFSPLMAEIDTLVVLAGINDLQNALADREPASPPGPIWARSHILARIRVLVHANPPLVREDAAGESYVERRARRRGMTVVPEPPDLGDALRRYRRDAIDLAEAAAARGVRVVFVTQPILWRDGLSPEAEALLWMGWLDDERRLDVPTLRVCLDRFNETLITVCAERSWTCIDLDMLHGDERLYYDDCHFNEAGSRAVAEIVAPDLIDVLRAR